MVAAAPGDDLVALGEAAHRLHLLGDLHRALDRFRAARAEEEPVEIAWREPGEHIAELHRRQIGVARRGDVSQLARLLGHRLTDFGAAMPDIDDVEPGETVEIGAALRVEQPAALAAHHDLEAVALGEVEPAGAVDPHMVERLPFDRREFACHRRVVVHRGRALLFPNKIV